MLVRTQFVGLEFRIFGGFGWVHSSVLVEKPLFVQRGLKFSFSRFGLGLAHFWLNRFKVWFFWRGLKGFEV